MDKTTPIDPGIAHAGRMAGADKQLDLHRAELAERQNSILLRSMEALRSEIARIRAKTALDRAR